MVSDSASASKGRQPRSSGQRAQTACKQCNARRVKCDAMQQRPCWQCRNRNLPCELINSRRGKYPRERAQPRAPSMSSPSTALYTSSHESQVDQPPAPSAHVPAMIESEVDNGEIAKDDKHDDEGPEMLFARMTETDSMKDSPGILQDQGRTIYLGEAFSLAFVVKTVCSPDNGRTDVKVHYLIPPSVADRKQPGISSEDEELLRVKGAFALPEKPVLDQFLRVFFTCIHPALPVFDRRRFAELYLRGRLSPLCLQTCLFLAATVCEESLLQRAGFGERSTACRAFYQRAKALHDADHEREKVRLTGILLLLGFWWQGPEDQKDMWFWLGAAISLAQTLGLHRSTALAELTPRRRSVWKRLWWSIYIRDRQAAAALGRPTRIRDEDCDVELLTEDDFRDQDTECPQIFGVQESYHSLYVIEMSKLAIILGRILVAEYSPRSAHNPKEKEQLAQDLKQWEVRLPPDLSKSPVGETLNRGYWSAMLHMCYHNCLILLFRPRFEELTPPGHVERDAVAREAADSATRIAEDLLTAGIMRYGQWHLIPALFATLSIHSISIQDGDSIRSLLAENRSRQCILALSELSKSWPVAGWISRAFVNLMRKLTKRSSEFEKMLHLHREGIGTNTPIRIDPGAGNGVSALGAPGAPLGRGDGTSPRPGLMTSSDHHLTDDAWTHDVDVSSFDFIFQGSLGGFGEYPFGIDSDFVPTYQP